MHSVLDASVHSLAFGGGTIPFDPVQKAVAQAVPCGIGAQGT